MPWSRGLSISGLAWPEQSPTSLGPVAADQRPKGIGAERLGALSQVGLPWFPETKGRGALPAGQGWVRGTDPEDGPKGPGGIRGPISVLGPLAWAWEEPGSP